MLRTSLITLALSAFAFGQDLIALLPAPGNTNPSVQLLDPLTLATVLAASPDNIPADIRQVIPMPGGSKYFLVSHGSTPITVLDAATGVLRTISGGLNLGATAALLVPDASRLAVAAGRVYFFNTATEALEDSGGIEISGQIIDLAVTFDSRRLLVASQATDGQIIVTAIDLGTTATVASTLVLPGSTSAAPGGMMIAPNGLCYLSGFSHVYEIDPRTNRITQGGDIFLPGSPGKAFATADGRYLMLPNLHPGPTAASLYQITIANRLPALFGSITNDTFESFAPQRTTTGVEGMFGFTRGGHLYDIRYGPGPSVAVSYADGFFTEGESRIRFI